jgi:hypothetical protein
MQKRHTPANSLDYRHADKVSSGDPPRRSGLDITMRKDEDGSPLIKRHINQERCMKMRMRAITLTILVVCFAGLTLSFAADNPNMGTWKLNEAKSKLAPGWPKNTMVVYTAAGDSVKVTVDGVDSKGSPSHNEWTGKFDGKDYPLTGDPMSDTRAYKKVNGNTMALTNKKDGKVTVTGKIVISADGKSRTVTTSATDPMGKKVTGTAVYDKQ